MNLEEKIYKDYIEAFKARNREKSDFLSFVRAELQNLAIGAKKAKLEDNEALSVLQKLRKRLEEAKEVAVSSSKKDFLEKTEKEISILNEYLPKTLSEEEILGFINEAITVTQAASMKDMGKVMKEVLAKVGTQADSKTVSDLVKQKLSGS
jgi:uncharacterized protein YqeY